MDIVETLNQLIAEGEALALKGGSAFEGYNEKDQAEYISWRYRAIAAINEVGDSTKHVIKDIEDDRYGPYFYSTSACRVLGGLRSALWAAQRTSALTSSEKGEQGVFRELNVHPRISSVCGGLYRDGHFEPAVFNASKALIHFVQERACRYDLDGTALMRTVFSRNNPVLAFNDLSDQSDLDEQEGMMHLFEGAVLAIRNPRGHSFLNDSPERALEYIGLLSMLASRVEETTQLKSPKVIT
jgi:uncharacterized protein (TIGR02391 family)